MDKLKPSEIVYLVVGVILVAACFGLICSTRILGQSEPVSVSTYNFSSDAYDVEVINSASYEDFLEVKGIGEAKATAIVNYREALGGFESVYQLGDLSAVSDSLLEAIIEHFYGDNPADAGENPSDVEPETDISENIDAVSSQDTPAVTTAPVDDETEHSETDATSSTKKSEATCERVPVDINGADAQTIASALLIDISVAEEIVRIRDVIGGYSNIRELFLCDNVTQEIYEKISDFVIIS